MHITIIGSGYVGLVSGACLADFGHTVTCVDKHVAKIEQLQAGGIPIFEPGLHDLVARNVAAGRLSFTAELKPAVAVSEVVFIAVGTPARRGDGHADLSYVEAAAREIAAALDGYTVVVTKSTVPVGTGDDVERVLREVSPDADFSVVSNPEFLREGAAIHDFKHPDRIVVGVEDQRGRAVMEEVYRPLHLNRGPLLFTGRRTAELIKYAANAFLATKITFINEMADLCEAVGADVQDVARGIGLDKRIGDKFLHAGPGYGGSCFPKDTLALTRTAREADRPAHIVETVVAVNDARKAAMADKVVRLAGGVEGKRVAVLGLTFKPNTDDMRDAPSLVIVPRLQARGAIIHAYDPEGMQEAAILLPDVVFHDDPYTAIDGADVLVILTEWDAFRALDLSRVKVLLRAPVVVDLRNIYEPTRMASLGFRFEGVGRGT
ncbi:MAG: UDP-glucose/GDP-mannose dehydrogenase family protein [Alphaproteobacteria bacterium]|nr:UDP-glucose/GDP-mannose dehydrogenase family protein [Alphaproteobacteria bacterium]MCB9693862.1 UDP-glucose/GDP-mannose dehydrogenase family protein [Alphaproteobacteria bacterium]